MKKRLLSCLFVVSLILVTVFLALPFNRQTPPTGSQNNNVVFQEQINPEYLQYLEDYKNGDTEKYRQVYPSPILYTNNSTPSSVRRTVAEIDFLPALDGRNVGTVTPVKNQGSLDTCWAFTGIAAAEGTVKRNTGSTFDFSEEHARFFLSNKNTGSIYSRKPYEAGRPDMVINYLMNESGTVLESSIPYVATQQANVSMARLHDRTLISTVFGGAKMVNFSERNSVKEEVYNNGAVTVTYLWNYDNYNKTTYALYNDTKSGGEAHASVVVGWDDDFPKSSFLNGSQLNNNGAWLIKNSWGKNDKWPFGDDGYFWLSYEDASIDTVGYSLIDSKPFNPNTTIRSLDSSIPGSPLLPVSGNFIYQANVFDISATEAQNNIISDVRFFSEIVQKYEIYIAQVQDGAIPSDLGPMRASGTAFAGWQTISLGQKFFEPLEGQYAVIIKLIDADNGIQDSPRATVEFGDGILLKPSLKAGRCFFSTSTGSQQTWTDFLDISEGSNAGHFMIKAVLRRTTDLPPAVVPTITKQPANLTVYTDEAKSLSVEVSVNDGGRITYQWFRSSTNTNVGGALIVGADSNTYIPPTGLAGTNYYYVEITNMLWLSSSSVTSEAASVTVKPRIPPVITTQPVDETIKVKESVTLFVAAISTDEGELSYQWFSNTVKSTEHGAPVPSENSDSFKVTGVTAGTFYYYVQVSNKHGSIATPVLSNVVTVTIRKLENTVMPTPRAEEDAIETITRSSISIKALPVVEDNGQTFGFEYAISTFENPLAFTWQANVHFSGLDPSTTYYIFARAAGNDLYVAGDPLKIATVKTDRALTWSEQNPLLSTIILWAAIAVIFIIVVRQVHPTKKKEIAADNDDDDGGRDSILPIGMTSST